MDAMDTAQEAVRALVKQPPIAVDADATLRQVASVLAEDYIGVAVVLGVRPSGAQGSYAGGLISERDIVRALAEGLDPDAERARDVMTVDLAAVAPGDSVLDVAELMLANEIRHVPVSEDDVVVGVVSERDVLRSFVAEHRAADRPS
jgi:signal-transduction protein with cAMP-binding, CBS, and nucleotidyltransferase domain